MTEIRHSLRRGASRMVALAVVGIAALAASSAVAEPLPAWSAPILFGAGLTILGVALGDFVLRVLQPKVDASDAATRAVNRSDMPSAVVYLARTLLAIAIMFLMVGASRAEAPPVAALQYLPVLKRQQMEYWPAIPIPAALGAQIEQETCITLKHRMCWNPRAELRTSREQGVGLGQFTRAFRADGSTRFDAMSEIAAKHQALAGLSWSNPYDPVLQIRALILKDRDIFDLVRWAPDPRERLAFSLAAYNGGFGGVMSDRQQCKATHGCNPERWFGHVERTSLKAKTAVHGYGKSFFEINREYPRNILGPRLTRYLVLTDDDPISLEKNGRGAS